LTLIKNIFYLLSTFGGLTWIFLGLSALLGLWHAWRRWFVPRKRLAAAEDKYHRLSGQVSKLREKKSRLGGERFRPVPQQVGFPGEARHRLVSEPLGATEITETAAVSSASPTAFEEDLPVGEGAAATAGSAALLAAAAVDSTENEPVEAPKLFEELPVSFEGEDVTEDEELGILYRTPPAQIDDLKRIRGVGPALERKLQKFGVYRFKQIASWNEPQIAAFSERLEDVGDRVERDHWIPQAKLLARHAAEEEAPQYKAPACVDHGARVESDFMEESVHVDDQLGIVYHEPPEVVDGLENISGVNSGTEEKLNDAGIFRFKQIEGWSDGNVGAVADAVGKSKQDLEEGKWVPQARRLKGETYRAGSRWAVDEPPLSDYEALGDELFPGEDVTADEEFGVLFSSTPEKRDDLLEITGIGQVLEKRLHSLGVYRYGQIANWSVANVNAFANQLNVNRDYIFCDEWIGEAETLLMEQESRQARAQPRPADRGTSAASTATTDTTATTATTPGLKTSDRLMAGVTHEDLPALVFPEASDVEKVEEIAKEPEHVPPPEPIVEPNPVVEPPVEPEPEPEEPASPPGFEGEDVHVDERLGVVYKSAPATVDDLTEIKGVGAVISRKLNEFGVYRFRQIATWNDDHVEAFAKELDTFKNRIDRDKWIQQAKKLSGDL